MNSKKNWANGGTTEQTRNANERASGKPERTSNQLKGLKPVESIIIVTFRFDYEYEI